MQSILRDVQFKGSLENTISQLKPVRLSSPGLRIDLNVSWFGREPHWMKRSNNSLLVDMLLLAISSGCLSWLLLLATSRGCFSLALLALLVPSLVKSLYLFFCLSDG